MYVAPTYDNFTAGSLASATLCAQHAEGPAAAPLADFAAAPSQGAKAAPAIERKGGWRRLVDIILSPISGPTLCPQRNGVRPV
jgi:hypothetical protein